MLWSEMGRKEGCGCTVTFRTSLRLRCPIRIQSIRAFPRQFKGRDTPPLGVLKNVFISVRFCFLTKGSNRLRSS